MSEKQTPGEAAEAAAIRRRWITLGELLAVVAVVISGLTFWNNYSERTAAESERAATKQKAAARSQTLLLKASASKKGDSLALAPADPAQAIQNLTITLPGALGSDPIEAVIEPRIEAGWIKDATRKARASGSGAGDLRLPVAITTRFVVDGETHSDTTLYDVGYKVDSGLLGSDVELRGLSLIERAQASNAQTRLDAIWKSRQRPSPE